MRVTAIDPPREQHHSFRHEALVYRGEAEFVDGTADFVREGVAAGEPILVVVSAAKIERLRERLGADADAVHFADMAEVGRNPARIIPAWREFVDAHRDGGRRFRGIGEPIFPERSDVELVECERHEALLNLAFADAPAWWLLCPYDRDALEPAIIDEARRNHPFVTEAGHRCTSDDYCGLEHAAAALEGPLPEPPGSAAMVVFDALSRLEMLRRAVAQKASSAGLDRWRTDDVVTAVNELATNSLRHGGGGGTLRIWEEGDALVCEVRDRGRIGDPLIGRQRPAENRENGRGLWLVNQLCDLVQLRSLPTGTVVRLHMSRTG